MEILTGATPEQVRDEIAQWLYLHARLHAGMALTGGNMRKYREHSAVFQALETLADRLANMPMHYRDPAEAWDEEN